MNKRFVNILFSIFISLFFIISAVKLTVNFKPLYRFDIKHLNIVENSGFSIEDIKQNYNYLIKYITSHNKEDFKIPNLPSSDEGALHFREVKNIFIKLDYLFFISSIITILALHYCKKNKDYTVFKYVSIFLISIPLILLITFLINFDKVFVIFHKLFFSNDYWIFDPAKDPVINMLPQDFFMHCGILINIFIIILSFLNHLLYKKNQI
ncbi:TIGR01906 family membrane protein [uncultured Clostridium sp.]|uniref:TIGR01906 family membrane protein n=1 Tax=uncultured Clostridium sp. TaxID=59620 RepID=UPI0028ED4FE5|nr:TIGR01906 family membrane protein [uncultured Clostridium sp.]